MNANKPAQSPSIIRVILTNITGYLLLCFCVLVCMGIGGPIALKNHNPALEVPGDEEIIYATGGLYLFYAVMGLYFIGKTIRELYRRKKLAA